MATFDHIDRFLNWAKYGDKCVNLSYEVSGHVTSILIAHSAKVLDDESGMHIIGVEHKDRIEHHRFGPFSEDFTLTLVKYARNVEYVTEFSEDFDEPCEILEENFGKWVAYERIENPFD